MRKVITIFFLTIFSMATTELGQLVKMPFLIQHYYIHQQKQHISLLEFFAEHYNSQHDDADKQQDMQLPFKAVNDAPTFVTGFPSQQIEIAEPTRIPVIDTPSQKQLASSKIITQIFHPPCTV